MGCPIYSYVVRLRMEQARQWLLERDKSIGDTAHHVGYKNTSILWQPTNSITTACPAS
ncbi:hypothetical protein [Spirosoma sp. KUDC1026]|uniref:hypothetical protein n=1 Tax=Spirosoma sp. KUDC1026 TaxID=2745947 RepID=UPI00397E60B4